MEKIIGRILAGIWLVAVVSAIVIAILADAHIITNACGMKWLMIMATIGAAPVAVLAVGAVASFVKGLINLVSWICTGESLGPTS